MIEISGLTQSYGKQLVLNGVYLHIANEERCALVGRNGAGKSTLIHSMLHLLPIRQGKVSLAGIPHDQSDWKRHVAYLPEKFSLYPQMTGEENLHFFAGTGGAGMQEERMERWLRSMELWEHRGVQVKKYSKGMLQRLGLAIMLYYETDILILDEPTSGLDPKGREEILSILQSLKGKTLLFSSHHLDEIRRICTHVAYLKDGEIRKYTVDEFDREVTI